MTLLLEAEEKHSQVNPAKFVIPLKIFRIKYKKPGPKLADALLGGNSDGVQVKFVKKPTKKCLNIPISIAKSAQP